MNKKLKSSIKNIFIVCFPNNNLGKIKYSEDKLVTFAFIDPIFNLKIEGELRRRLNELRETLFSQFVKNSNYVLDRFTLIPRSFLREQCQQSVVIPIKLQVYYKINRKFSVYDNLAKSVIVDQTIYTPRICKHPQPFDTWKEYSFQKPIEPMISCAIKRTHRVTPLGEAFVDCM